MRTILAITFIALFAASASAQPARPASVRVSEVTAKTTPDDRARQWLTLLDDGDFDRCWREAGSALKSRTGRAAWAARVKAMREPLGAMSSRDLKSIELFRPDQAVVRYDSAFAHKAKAVESVTLSLENGGWSVTDYGLQ